MRLAAILLIAVALPAQAEIYKFVDENGFVTYTNMPRPGSRPQLVIPDKPGVAPYAPGGAGNKRKPATKSATPSYFPKVAPGTQRKRDDMRRQLLMEERSSEERNLSAARSAYATGSRQPGANLNKLMDAVRLHEKNIEMLNKELSHIR